MTQQRYSGYPAVINYGVGPTTLNVQQLHGISVKPDAKKDEVIPSGAIDRLAVILQGAEPVVTFKTHDIATILTAISPTVGLLAAGTGGNSIQFQKRADGGTFTTGSTHVVLSNKKAMLVPKRLTASQDKPAELELEMWCLWDGSTTGSPAQPVPPLAISSTSALGSTPAFNGEFYLGPVYANSVQVPSIKDFEIDFGLEYKPGAFDGDLWPQVGSILSRKPKFTATLTDSSVVSTVGSMFNAALPGVLAFYLRAGVAGAARASDATAGHIKLSCATGTWDVPGMDSEGQDDVSNKLNAEATSTLSYGAASTIP